jgi:hypothetical protein
MFLSFSQIILSLTGIPIALRVIYAGRFVRGPFHLGRFSYPIAIAAVLWIAFISIVFCLPELNPVNSQTLNYAPVAVGIVLTYALGFWAISARRWFAGPIKQIAGAPALYSFFISTDDRWSACTGEEMGISVAESVVISDSEKPESSEKSTGP